jgi:hypothetical protein
MDQPTIMTADHRQMLSYWYGMQPEMGVEGLANNMIRRFKMSANTAWILAVRFINERRGQ